MNQIQYDGAARTLACNDYHPAVSERPNPDIIAASSIGDELNATESRALASAMTTRRLSDGETLVAEGDNDHTLYLLAMGRLAVISARGNQDIKLYVMKAGECAGTRAFVDRLPRTAKLRAAGDTIVYALTPEAFEDLLETHPGVVCKVMRALLRITHTNLMRMNHESQQLSNYIRKSNGRY